MRLQEHHLECGKGLQRSTQKLLESLFDFLNLQRKSSTGEPVGTFRSQKIKNKSGNLKAVAGEDNGLLIVAPAQEVPVEIKAF